MVKISPGPLVVPTLTWLPPQRWSQTSVQTVVTRRGAVSSHYTVTFKYLMIASGQTSYCWGYCGVLDPHRPQSTLLSPTQRPPLDPWNPWTPHLISLSPSQILIHVYWIVFTHRRQRWLASLEIITREKSQQVRGEQCSLVGECHNKRRGVITDLSVLPPSGPRTIYISEIKTWPGKMSVFCSIQKKVFNAPKLRVHWFYLKIDGNQVRIR